MIVFQDAITGAKVCVGRSASAGVQERSATDCSLRSSSSMRPLQNCGPADAGAPSGTRRYMMFMMDNIRCLSALNKD